MIPKQERPQCRRYLLRRFETYKHKVDKLAQTCTKCLTMSILSRYKPVLNERIAFPTRESAGSLLDSAGFSSLETGSSVRRPESLASTLSKEMKKCPVVQVKLRMSSFSLEE